VEVQWAVTATSVGSHPAAADPAWHGVTFYGNTFVLRASATILIPGGSAGNRVWARVRSVPGAAYNALQQPSAWVYSNSADMTGLTAPTGISVTQVGATSALVSWTPGDSVSWVEVDLQQPTGQPYVAVQTLPPGTAKFTLTGLTAGQSVTVQVRATDLVGGYSTGISAAFTLSGADPTLLPPPRPYILPVVTNPLPNVPI
jgi:hypothetical protein